MGQYQVSGGVSVLCWHAAPFANVLWKLHTISQKVKFGNKVQIRKESKLGVMEGVTVFGHPPECHVTFGRGEPHIVW